MSRKFERNKYVDSLCSLSLLLIVVLCICSCTSENSIFDNDNTKLLNFSVSVPEWKNNDSTSNSKTRATPISGSSFDKASSFNIIADAYDGTKNYNTIINNEAVSYTNNMWQTTAPHYWPGTTTKTVSFYAYYPASIYSSISHTAGSAPTLSYTVPNDVASQIDIMTATGTNVSGNTNSSTPLAFNHIFAAVKFNIGSAGMPNGTITGITLNNILYKGTYSLNGTWSQDVTAKKSFSQTVSVSTNAGTTITSDATTFMMMPQTLVSDASITVTYSNGGTLTKTIYGNWEASKIYTYNLSYPPRTFNYTGNVQSYTVPITGIYKLEVWGAAGGGSDNNNTISGGKGGYSYGNIKLSQGITLYIVIGGAGSSYNVNSGGNGGYNGGGNGGNGSTDIIAFGGSGGGGATHISIFDRGTLNYYSSNQNEILIVAGGGGGYSNVFLNLENGSSGGGINGGSATATDYSHSVNGGTQNNGYAFGKGQQGASKSIWKGAGAEGNGGGGGGWYGGFAYQGTGENSCCYGAGGSGHLGSDLISGTTGMTNGVRIGNGYAIITFVSAN